MEKLSRRKALIGLAGAGAAMAGVAKAEGAEDTEDPNLSPKKKGGETCSSTLRSPTIVSKVRQ